MKIAYEIVLEQVPKNRAVTTEKIQLTVIVMVMLFDSYLTLF